MIFLDHASTTPIDPRVRDFLIAEMAEPQNSSSVHRHGQKARARLEAAREEMAQLLSVQPSEVVFTASASEANNLAIRGLEGRAEAAGRCFRAASSDLEHACIRETLKALASRGKAEVERLGTGPDGRVKWVDYNDSKIDLLCLLALQNETGVVQSLAQARRFADAHSALWLCDFTQSFGLLEISAKDSGADMVSLSSHKLHGPPGVGVLAGPAVPLLHPQITGGPQENERRAGTQPVALIRAFAMAARLAAEGRAAHRQHLAALEGAFRARLDTLAVPHLLNGDPAHRMPGFMNLSFPGMAGADLAIALDARGFSVSSGSACATGVMEVSPTMAAMFPNDPDRARGAIRITPGRGNSEAEMVALADALGEVLLRPRSRRP